MAVSGGRKAPTCRCGSGRIAPPPVSLPVRTTPEADIQILAIDGWWRANRPSSADLFLEELSAVFELLSEAPSIGRLYRESPVRNTRRVLLKGTRYHVYYVLGTEEVKVLALWHAQRSVGPPLRMR
jgi:plasmid stabilization system protein ParE